MFNEYPYRNLTDLNLDFLLNTIKKVEKEIHEFVTFNALKYADPIQWDITRQYEKNTIVIDPLTGTAYISVQAVPYGVALTNTDYWSVVFDLEQFVTKANNNFTLRVETQTTTTATFNTPLNHWLIWGGILYRATTNITAGDRYVVDSNIVRVTVADTIGIIQNLDTNETSNIVAAINEVLSRLLAEAQARQDADTALQQNIDSEAQARQDADTTLQQNINAVSQNLQTEAQARQDADTTLQQNIDSEAQARQDADTALQHNIDNEAQARQTADNNVRTDLTNYVNEQIASLNEFHNALVFGNSYASGTGSPDGYGIYHYIEPLFDRSWLFSGSGTSFIDYDGQHQDDTFLTWLNVAINADYINNNDIDTIVIIGAYGESRAYIQNGRAVTATRDALRSAVNSFKSIATSSFINLKRIIYVNCESRLTNRVISGGYTSFISDSYQVDNVLTPLLLDNQIINLGWCGIDALYQANCFSQDGYHPNTLGYRTISTSLINKLRGGANTRYFNMAQQLDIGGFTGVSDMALTVNWVLTPYQSIWSTGYASMPRTGTLSLATTDFKINLNNVIIPPPRNPLGAYYARSGNVEDKSFNVLSKITIEGDDMFLNLRSNRAINATVQQYSIMAFDFGTY